MKDLRYLTILCAHCNTRVTLDLEMEFDPKSGHKPFTSPAECPRCGSRFDSAVPDAVNAMQRVYRSLAGLGDSVSFTGSLAPPAADRE